MLERTRAQLARWIAPKSASKPSYAVRMYASARASRLSSDWPTMTSSADTELSSSLTNLRNRSRSLTRDNPYAKRAKTIVTNNVVGAGIGLQAQVMNSRGKLNQAVCAAIEEEWGEWCKADSCHTGGRLHFCDLERQACDQVFEAGEIIIRMHPRPFGRSRVPFALELIESERIADEWTTTNPPPGGGIATMGIERDQFDRPMYYWIRERHPGELRNIPGASQRLERVPADQIIHLYVCERWPQARGVPWLHAVIARLRDMDGYTEAEITAARASACYMGFIESAEGIVPDSQEGDQRQLEFSPGLIEQLRPGQKYIDHSPTRPNTALDPFMRYMLREVAAGVGVSYESLSRDYSQSNYSSSRLSLLDDRDLWRMLQGWFIRNFRAVIHERWLQMAVLARAIPYIPIDEYAANPRKFEAVRFKPRGWGWVDPTKEVEAYKQAVRCGFTTVTDVIAATAGGQDIEDVLNTRRRELDLMSDDLVFDTDPAKVDVPATTTAPEAPKEGPEEDEESGQRVVPFRGYA